MQPPALTEYKRTQTFTSETVPKALTRRHNTKADVWAKLVIESGQVTLTLCDDNRSLVLPAGGEAWLPPQAPHFIQLAANTAFHIVFFRRDTSG